MRILRLLLFLFTASLSAAETFTWSGAAGDDQYTNPANWIGGVVPPNNGTAILVFGNAQTSDIVLPLILDVAQIQFQNTAAHPYSFDSAYFTLLNIRNGITSSPVGGTERIGESIALNLNGSQTINVASGSLEIAGAIFGDSLIKSGAGNLRISGVNLLTSGTQVQSGALLFSSLDALPASGLISVSHTGYVGAENASTLKGMLGQLDRTSFYGTIGLDSAPGATSPAVYSDQIDVTGLANYAGLGSTTSARLVGNFRVNSNQDYRFSGGAGTLYVETNLTSSSSNLLINSAFGQPLTVVLRGSNNFGGTLNVLNSVLVLDSTQAITPGRVLNLANPGYIGATERYTTSTASFLSLLHATSPSAIAGLDSSNLASPRTISDAIDLSVGGTRTDPYYLGTSTKVTLTGAITPTVGDSLYLTAVKGGQLVVASTLGSNIPGLVVGQANSFDPQGGIVEITGHNNYTGGTKILGGTLRVSNDAALGSGAVTVGKAATLDVSAGTRFSNAFSLDSGARLAGNGSIGTPGGAIFASGAILSPGGLDRVGTLNFTSGLTLGSGSIIEFDIKNLSGSPGTGWDSINAYGTTINLTATSLSPITIDLTTLSLDGSTGLLSGFDASQSYSWLFTSNVVSGFSSDKFVFTTTNFANDLGSGTFFVSQGNGGLSINFTPVPEPSTCLLLAMGLAVVTVFELRRRKK
jgi:autotransporter-associated beta strand protein